jgi:3-hydroxyisobutyrate dehydrogenase-like beta-hydroxyacid dehydrogenase
MVAATAHAEVVIAGENGIIHGVRDGYITVSMSSTDFFWRL